MIDRKVLGPVRRSVLTEQERRSTIRSSMFLKAKYHPDGTFDKLKARLVVRPMSLALVVIFPFELTPNSRHSAICPYPRPAFTKGKSANALPVTLLDPDAVSTANVRSSVQ
jgi:hypothetical protein